MLQIHFPFWLGYLPFTESSCCLCNVDFNASLFWQVTVQKAQINKARFSKGISVKYKVNLSSKSKDFIETPIVKNTLEPEFKHSKVISIPKLKSKHKDFFEHGCITFCVYGKQEDTLPDPKLLKLTTRVS